MYFKVASGCVCVNPGHIARGTKWWKLCQDYCTNGRGWQTNLQMLFECQLLTFNSILFLHFADQAMLDKPRNTSGLCRFQSFEDARRC